MIALAKNTKKTRSRAVADDNSIKGRQTDYGFEWGAAKVERGFSDDRRGWVVILLTTPKHPKGIQLYITKTGKVRVLRDEGEWKPKGDNN